MNRFFRTTPAAYKSIRSTMDASSGYPSTKADTWFAPVADAPQDADGNPLIAAIDPIAAQFAAAGAEELTAEEYQAALPQPEPEEL